ncbi:unnamed protein product [Miscanthus lutarioriparius]|uniref:BHLH domain-containing protein n=1 Tax=Miscanthus lutarioriparius TaxID=422564 RepID=A0A811P3V7_9POAL|nr:unnamed protein product [Miscanthus lutarioriparius]
MSSSSGSGRSATEARALKIHSEAERRRRERINAHLATLRSMIPDTRQVCDGQGHLACQSGRASEAPEEGSKRGHHPEHDPAPETDEVSIELNTGADRVIYIRASISCDDRPDLVAGLAQAFHGLRLRTVRADMTSLGGRARHVFVLCKCKEEGWGSGSAGPSASLRSLKEAVRQALARVASPETAYGSRPFQSKRQRILESHYSIMSI